MSVVFVEPEGVAIEVRRAPRITVSLVKATVAKFYKLTPAQLEGPRRTRNLVYPRQAAMYLAKTLTPNSFPQIGKMFGGRDHTTVMHAVRQVEQRRIAVPALQEELTAITAALKHYAAGDGI